MLRTTPRDSDASNGHMGEDDHESPERHQDTAVDYQGSDEKASDAAACARRQQWLRRWELRLRLWPPGQPITLRAVQLR